MSLKHFTTAYIDAALFSTNDESDESGGVPLDRNYGARDISPETRRQMELDCATFYEANEATWSANDDQDGLSDHRAGHDFWLTRNGHGTGFWDEDEVLLSAENGTLLSDESKEFGTFDLYVGGDGQIHGSPLSEQARTTAMAGLGYGGHEDDADAQRDRRDYERGRQDASNELRTVRWSAEDIREYLASTRSKGGAYQRGYNEVMRAHLTRGAGVGDTSLHDSTGFGGLAKGLGFWNPKG